MINDLFPILQQRWRSFGASFLVCAVAVVVVTLALPKTYQSTATLSINPRPVARILSIDSQLGQDLARSFSTLAGNPNVAQEAAQRLRATSSIHLTRDELLSHMSFAPVEQTELIQITASAHTAVDAQTMANAYASVFASRIAGQFAAGQVSTTVDVAESGALAHKPSKPNVPLYVGLGLLLSLLVGLGTALSRDRLDRRIRISETDETVLGQPVAARIPVLGDDIARNDGADDAFLLLKANLGFFLEESSRVVAVTSAGPREGKTTISVGLVRAVTRGDETAVLIEADLRRPTLANSPILRGAEPASVGLSNYLVGGASVSDIVTRHPKVDGLSIIWSGPPAPSAIPLLRSSALAVLLDSLRELYDWIVIDTPPILLGADASNVVARVNATIFVIDARGTTAQAASQGLAQVRKVDHGLLAVALNRASTPDFSAYYGTRSARGEGRGQVGALQAGVKRS